MVSRLRARIASLNSRSARDDKSARATRNEWTFPNRNQRTFCHHEPSANEDGAYYYLSSRAKRERK
jgi:hypothetical protein